MTVWEASCNQLRMRGTALLTALGGLACVMSILAAGRSVVLPFSLGTSLDLGALCCLFWVPLFRALAQPRGWTLEAREPRFGRARVMALGVILIGACGLSAAIASLDPSISAAMAARNTALVAGVIWLLARVIGADPAAMVPVAFLAVLMLAGKADSGTVAPWAVILRPASDPIPNVVAALGVLGALAAESQTIRLSRESGAS